MTVEAQAQDCISLASIRRSSFNLGSRALDSRETNTCTETQIYTDRIRKGPRKLLEEPGAISVWPGYELPVPRSPEMMSFSEVYWVHWVRKRASERQGEKIETERERRGARERKSRFSARGLQKGQRGREGARKSLCANEACCSGLMSRKGRPQNQFQKEEARHLL